jgi:hypothetical protein
MPQTPALALPYTFVNGTIIDAGQMNADLQALLNGLNMNTRTVLQAPTTFYVAPGGSNTPGNGLSPASPAATMTWMYQQIQETFDTNQQIVTLQLANGTYNESVGISGPMFGQAIWYELVIQGNTTSPNLVTVIGDPCFNFNSEARGTIQGLTVQSSVSSGLQAHYNGRIRFQNINFGPCLLAHLSAFRSGSIQALGNYQILTGTSGAHGECGEAGELFLDITPSDYVGLGTGAPTVTLTGTPNFSNAFLVCNGVSSMRIGAAFSPSTGGATGIQAKAGYNGVINIVGQGTAYLPGSAAWVLSNGGQIG